MAAQEDLTAPVWRTLANWRNDAGTLFFSDPGANLRYEGYFGGDTLSGLWRSEAAIGEWWCAPVDIPEAVAAASDGRPNRARFPLPNPVTMRTPTYPRDAIRGAREGQIVVCFKVDHLGVPFDPRVVTETDEIFRRPTLDALLTSRFLPWPEGAERPPRPACRTYTFRLEPDYDWQ